MFIYTIITIAIECEWSTRKINWTGNGMCKSAKKRTRMNKSIKQQDDFTLRSSDYVQNNTRKNLSQGATYIAITILVLFVLLYVFPVGLKFNISAFLQGEKQLGIMRLILGIVLLVVLCMSLGRIVDANTLFYGYEKCIAQWADLKKPPFNHDINHWRNSSYCVGDYGYHFISIEESLRK